VSTQRLAELEWMRAAWHREISNLEAEHPHLAMRRLKQRELEIEEEQRSVDRQARRQAQVAREQLRRQREEEARHEQEMAAFRAETAKILSRPLRKWTDENGDEWIGRFPPGD